MSSDKKANAKVLKNYRSKSELTERKRKAFDLLTMLISLICFAGIMWTINIYRNTLVDWKFSLIVVITGITITLLISFFFWKKVMAFYPLWSFIVYCCLWGGSIPYSSILVINQELAQTKQFSDTFQVKQTGHFSKGRYSCGPPYVIIDFNGLEKQLVFSCDLADDIKLYHKVALCYSTGYFGYNVIRNKELTR